MRTPLTCSPRRLRIRRSRPLLVEQLETRSFLALVVTVNSALDTDARDAVLTLREAMEFNNGTLNILSLTAQERAQIVSAPSGNDTNTIGFNIPGTDSRHFYYANDSLTGQVSRNKVTPTVALDDQDLLDPDPDWPHSWWSIQPSFDLPRIVEPVTIDGYTQPGAKTNTNAARSGKGLNAILRIEVGESIQTDTNTSLVVGPYSDPGSTTIRGLVVGQELQAISSQADGSVFEGNFIGTDVSGTLRLDTIAGIDIEGVSQNRIGGTQAASRNLLNGESFAVFFDSYETAAANNTVQGNLIGTDISGTKSLQIQSGVFFFTSQGGEISDNLIGGPDQDARNLISGGFDGITFRSYGTIHDNVIEGNYIGTDVTGLSNLGNYEGIVFDAVDEEPGDDGKVQHNTIMSNRIAFNANRGIIVKGPATGNSILSNTIYGSALGIDLGDDFITPNDPSDTDAGPNNLQNFPVLSSATLALGMTLTLQYSVPSQTSNSSYPLRIEFFKADSTGLQGQTFLGADTYLAAEAETVKTISLTPPVPIVGGDKIVATATDASGNTSEFSDSTAIPNPTCSTAVATVNDSGPGSLREAIDCANIRAGLDTISFDIAGNGVHTIRPASPLPTITDPVTIDGYTQSGAVPNSLAVGDNAVLQIEVDGADLTGENDDGLHFGDGLSSATVRGLAINGFPHSAIWLSGLSGADIEGNFLGTNVAGAAAAPNGADGITIIYNSAPVAVPQPNVIGGATPAARNIISGNRGFGIYLGDVELEGLGFGGGDIVQGNYIGTDASGTVAIPNSTREDETSGAGLRVYSSHVRIGGTDAAARNLISGNHGSGIDIREGFGAVRLLDVQVQGNFIGTDATGAAPLGNTQNGIVCSEQVTLGGIAPGAPNKIAFNGQDGVFIDALVNKFHATSILGNSIFSNGVLGIDLWDLGPILGALPNDPGDADTGPNNLQNFPEISHATKSGGLLKLTYTVPSDPANSTYPIRVEFFQADSDGQEGQTFLGFDTFTADDFAAGGKTVTFSPAASIKVFDKIVATATDSLPGSADPANTSEFSASVIVASPWLNPRNRLDVNNDTHVAPNDAVAVINFLNGFKGGLVPDDADNSQPFLDVNGDNNVAPNDALDIINAINAGLGGEGEFEPDQPPQDFSASQSPTAADDLLALLAYDTMTQNPRKRQ